MPDRVSVDRVSIEAFEIPTDRPESDGTLSWTSTTMIVVGVHCSTCWGMGYTYGPRAIASVIGDELASIVTGSDPMTPEATWKTMHAQLRNAGQQGIVAMAISAVDIALHDLRARLLDVPLAGALGAVSAEVPIYGSGGFTSYTLPEIAEQLDGWVRQGIPRVKIKVGRHPQDDEERLRVARAAIGPQTELMVDANGAFCTDQALQWVRRYADHDVRWLEEPVTQDNPAGLHRIRASSPPEMSIASGEYSWSHHDTARLLDAVDVMQADVTRCGGPSELACIDRVCASHDRPLSLHCAPAISAHVGCALTQMLHLEYFHDHVRIEEMLFDGTLEPAGGVLRPDLTQPGHGLTLKRVDAGRYAIT